MSATAMRSALLLITLLACTAATAQQYPPDAEHMAFSGGLIFGMNMSQVDGDTYNGYHKVGLNTGGVVYIHFSKSFGISMELLYTQKGSRSVTQVESPSIGTYFSQYDIKLNYVEVPLTVHGAGGKYNYEAGISYARLIRSHEDIILDYPVVIDPVKARFENYDLNYIIGASRKLYKGLYANVRFQYSITSIRPWDRIPVGYSYGTKGQFNNLVAIRLMYWL